MDCAAHHYGILLAVSLVTGGSGTLGVTHLDKNSLSFRESFFVFFSSPHLPVSGR